MLYVMAGLIVFAVVMAGACIWKGVRFGAWSARAGYALFSMFCVIGAFLLFLLIAPLYI